MTDKQAMNLIFSGANFTLEYGTNYFHGNISEFKTTCKNVIDYFHQSNNYFNLWLIVENKYEYTINSQVKSKIKKILAF